MKLNEFRRKTGMRHNSVNDTGNRTRYHSAGIIDPVAHGITAANLNGNGIFFHKSRQLHAERNYIAVDISPRNIFQVASGADTDFQTVPDNTEVMFHGLSPCHFHFVKNMVV